MTELTAPKSAADATEIKVNRVPSSTYRLQLGADLTLNHVSQLLPYLQKLGISDFYLSPLFRARSESSHGYDVVDHGTIDPAIGNLAAFEQLAAAARDADMGILLDVVPNHMGVNDPGNVWWLDVLENGEGSTFADFFDIDWQPAASALQDKLLLPFLGEPFGRVLENGELRVVYAEQRLQLTYCSRRFPLALPSWIDVLSIALADRSGTTTDGNLSKPSDWAELESIITQLGHLPSGSRRDSAAMKERYREQRIARQRLQDLLACSPGVRAALDRALVQINGETGNAKSFDLLESLLEKQWYRLAYWRVAADEINYRRFFDVNDLAAIRVENPRVFDAVHRLLGRLLEMGWVTGLRIDHPDGLRDPQDYFRGLQALYRQHQSTNGNDAVQIYVVAEKILSGDEPLPSDWAVSGTTGYDLLNILSRLQVHPEGLIELRSFYDRLTGNSAKPADIVYESKRTVLVSSMSSELQMLAAALYRIAQQHRASRDFTRPALQRALREVIACMTVYRTYVRGDSWDVSDADYRTVVTAVRMAKRRNRTLPVAVFDYVASVLLLEHPPTVSEEQAAERRKFALKFQQVSGPVAAKGVEDTAFYRYYPLASLNEVGGELDAKPLSVDEFHRAMRHRLESWPHSISATSTHDSKRGEDMRARLHVLSDAPQEWSEALARWQKLSQPFVRELDGDTVPDANEQYLLFQTLVGTWPIEEMDEAQRGEYAERIIKYAEKAFREAKLHSSWMNPSEPYETAVFDFIRGILGENGGAFRVEMTKFVRRISNAGFVNSLAQLVLKMTVPGVPDFYRGTELWDFNLVDPDNRRPIDYDARRNRLDRLSHDAGTNVVEFAGRLAQKWPDPDIKLWVTSRCLALRRSFADLFSRGDYVPLSATEDAAEHVIGFARRYENEYLLSIVPRYFYAIQNGKQAESQCGAPHGNWNGARLALPGDFPREWRCELSGRAIQAHEIGDELAIDLAELFEVWPVAILTAGS